MAEEEAESDLLTNENVKRIKNITCIVAFIESFEKWEFISHNLISHDGLLLLRLCHVQSYGITL